jgi:hypothetical protein
MTDPHQLTETAAKTKAKATAKDAGLAKTQTPTHGQGQLAKAARKTHCLFQAHAGTPAWLGTLPEAGHHQVKRTALTAETGLKKVFVQEVTHADTGTSQYAAIGKRVDVAKATSVFGCTNTEEEKVANEPTPPNTQAPPQTGPHKSRHTPQKTNSHTALTQKNAYTIFTR